MTRPASSPRKGPARRRAPRGRPNHLVVTGYLVDRSRVLLLFHRKLRRWLPPGGHVEEGEDPLAALAREFLEETGLRVRPVPGASRLPKERGVRLLPVPHHVQVEWIDSAHDHLDLVYFCRRVGGRLRRNEESEDLRWFARQDLRDPSLGANVRTFALQALDGRVPGRSGVSHPRSTVGTEAWRSSLSFVQRARTRAPP